RVRAQVGIVFAAPGGGHAEVLDVEETILQAEVEAVGDRDADAGQQLPREAAVVVVGEQPLAAGAVTLEVELGVDADPAVAGTTADEEVDPVARAEVDQGVGHQAGDREVAVEPAFGLDARGDRVEVDQVAGDAVDADPLVRAFTLEPEPAEVV